MLKYLINPMQKADDGKARITGYDELTAKNVKAFHSRLPGYTKTPLRSLPGLATRLGLDSIFVKDESSRFGLQSFKALGGSYAAARLMAKKLGLDPTELSRLGNGVADLLPDGQKMTFITATDGNHGRGVAWVARELGQKAVVLMPKGSSDERVRHIRALGADCSVTEMNYDDTVRRAGEMAAANNWELIQDTAWPGYEEVPEWIMQGYLTLALETWQDLQQAGKRPTHVLLQAGVGSLAASVAAFFVNAMPENRPRLIIVEPQAADCFYVSAKANDGLPHAVGGDLATIMAGLACGEPSSLAWPIIRDHAFAFLSLADPLAALGMRVLAAPLPGDPALISGESAAGPIGALAFACRYLQDAAPARSLGLCKDSVVVSLSTEGDTFPAMFEEIVWQGAKPLQL